jgi:hypothetical protein
MAAASPPNSKHEPLRIPNNNNSTLSSNLNSRSTINSGGFGFESPTAPAAPAALPPPRHHSYFVPGAENSGENYRDINTEMKNLAIRMLETIKPFVSDNPDRFKIGIIANIDRVRENRDTLQLDTADTNTVALRFLRKVIGDINTRSSIRPEERLSAYRAFKTHMIGNLAILDEPLRKNRSRKNRKNRKNRKTRNQRQQRN